MHSDPLTKHSNDQRPIIGIDGRNLLHQRTGVERVSYHFIDSMQHQRERFRCIVFSDQPLPAEIHERWDHEVVVVPPCGRTTQALFDVWLAWRLPHYAARHNIALFVTPYHKFPLFSKVPAFCMLHGLEWHHYPSGYRRVERWKQWFWFQMAARYATGIITFAENTLNDVRDLTSRSVPVRVVPEGINPHFRELNADESSNSILSALNVPNEYVLSVCSLEPRKNVDGLIRAFASAIGDADLPHHLVLAGRSGWQSDRLQGLIAEHGVKDRVHFTGYVDDEQLLHLYNRAAVFCYPSKYEGFGLPVVEALACGTPVITSNGSSLREVAGDAAELVDPHDDDSIAAALVAVLQDSQLRDKLKRAGFENIQRFGWDKMADQICTFIEQTLGDEPGTALSLGASAAAIATEAEQ